MVTGEVTDVAMLVQPVLQSLAVQILILWVAK